MPYRDGLSATEALRAQGNELPIILMSAHALLEEQEKGKKAGATDFITKPINQAELIKILKRHLS